MKPADRLRELADWFDVDAHGHMSWETKQARAADIRAVLEALSRAEGALEDATCAMNTAYVAMSRGSGVTRGDLQELAEAHERVTAALSPHPSNGGSEDGE